MVYHSGAKYKLLGQTFVGELPGNRKAVLSISPANGTPKWFNS
jgi:hypothetical protein